MKRMMKRLLPVLMAIAPLTICAQKVYELKDISGKVQVNVIVNDKNVEYSVLHDNDVMVAPSPIFMKLTDGTAFGLNPKVKKISRRSVNETIYPPIYKKKSIKDQFNELTIDFKGGYSLVFRAYEDGAAYRFVSELKKPFMVESEQASFCFPNDPKVFVASPKGRMNEGKKDPFYSSFQNTYLETALSAWDKEQIAFLPVLVEGKNGKKICITEADLMNYPGMYVKHGEHGYSLDGIFAAYPKTIVDEVRGLKGVVKSREPYIARVEGNTAFPWRVMVIAKDDAELLCNDMVYKLATPAQFTDFSWIKPGKVAWDWWNDWNLYNVDFRAGINNETYKYYIDFASKFGIPYIIMDEGWAKSTRDPYTPNPKVDLHELIRYGKEKNVGIVLWLTWLTVENNFDLFKTFNEWGIKGVKIDFMDRSDQWMVNYYERVAKEAAKHHLFVDFHGSFKPAGLEYKYPNILSYEGVRGMEQMGGCYPDNSIYLPFMRNAVGPMDYTPGAMISMQPNVYRAERPNSASIGTRAYQLALFVIFESGLQMLADNPTLYYRNEDCTRFITSVPVTWDETVALEAKAGEYAIIAKRKGDKWFIGGMTNNGQTEREFAVKLDFLKKDRAYQMTSFEDGINAGRQAMDYRCKSSQVKNGDVLTVKMVRNGGFAAVIE